MRRPVSWVQLTAERVASGDEEKTHGSSPEAGSPDTGLRRETVTRRDGAFVASGHRDGADQECTAGLTGRLTRRLAAWPQQLRQWACWHRAPGWWRRGSAMQLVHRGSHVALQCPWCGKESPGFTIDVRIARTPQPSTSDSR